MFINKKAVHFNNKPQFQLIQKIKLYFSIIQNRKI